MHFNSTRFECLGSILGTFCNREELKIVCSENIIFYDRDLHVKSHRDNAKYSKVRLLEYKLDSDKR